MAPALRDLSNASRLWLAAGLTCPPVANQMVIEGYGTFDIEQWRKAVARVTELNPGLRLTLGGHLASSHWVDSGLNIPVKLVDASGWDGRGLEKADFLSTGFDHRSGAMAEVLLLPGDPARAIFRSHHAIMDGRGILTWVDDVFKVLRGEPIREYDVGITENELLNFSKEKTSKPIAQRFIAPHPRGFGKERGIIWRKLTVQGRFAKLLPQVLLLMAKEIWRFGMGRVRFGIPVDLRSRREGVHSTGNLTNAIFVEITPASTIESLAHEISQRLKERRDGQITWEDKMVPYIPLRVFEMVLRAEARWSHRTMNYRCSGLISNIGRYSMESLAGGGFSARDYWAVPVCLESIPLSIVMTGVDDRAHFVLAMPRALADYAYLDEALARMADGLVEAPDA